MRMRLYGPRARYDAARLGVTIFLAPGGQPTKGLPMGNVAVADELAGADTLEELYRLDATETEPDDEDEDAEDDEDDDDGGMHPEEIPHP
jgi:hypothetical protein